MYQTSTALVKRALFPDGCVYLRSRAPPSSSPLSLPPCLPPPPSSPTPLLLLLPAQSLCCTRCSRRVHVPRMTSLWLQVGPSPSFVFISLLSDGPQLVIRKITAIMWDHVPLSSDPSLSFVLSKTAPCCWGLGVIIRSRLLQCVQLSNWKLVDVLERVDRAQFPVGDTAGEKYLLTLLFMSFFVLRIIAAQQHSHLTILNVVIKVR